jgi:hypothetical protein
LHDAPVPSMPLAAAYATQLTVTWGCFWHCTRPEGLPPILTALPAHANPPLTTPTAGGHPAAACEGRWPGEVLS